MITTEEYIQLKAFSRVDGLYLGLLWILSFACCIAGLNTPVIGSCGTLLAVASPLFALARLKKFRDYARDGRISFRRAFVYYILCFFYASTLLALMQYIYFAFLDKGTLVQAYSNLLTTPEATEMVKAYGLTVLQAQEYISLFSQMTPIFIALNIMTMNNICGVILGLPAALLAMRYR